MKTHESIIKEKWNHTLLSKYHSFRRIIRESNKYILDQNFFLKYLSNLYHVEISYISLIKFLGPKHVHVRGFYTETRQIRFLHMSKWYNLKLCSVVLFLSGDFYFFHFVFFTITNYIIHNGKAKATKLNLRDFHLKRDGVFKQLSLTIVVG